MRNLLYAFAALVFSAASVNAQVFWSMAGGTGSVDQIQNANADGSGFGFFTVNGSPNGASPWAVAANPTAGQVYWSDTFSSNRGVFRANLDGTNQSNIVPGASTAGANVTGLGINAASGSLYMLTATTLYRSNLDGSSPTAIVTGLSSANGLTVDSANGFLYWSQAATGNHRIARANLDGTNVQTVVDTNVNNGSDQGVALDGIGGLYWVDRTTDNIYRADVSSFTGSPLPFSSIVNLNTVLGGTSTSTGLASDGTYLFWTEGSSSGTGRGIYRSLIDGSSGALFMAAATGASPLGVYATTPVPEPGTMLLTGMMAMSLILIRNRKRRIR